MFANRDEVVETTPSISILMKNELLPLSILEGMHQEYPLHMCVHEWIASQAHQTPDAVALELDDQTLTYGELNCRANQLAHLLQTLGVRPNVLVGICMERTPDLVVGLLGILKAGGAYLPLDPAYPKDRLSFMMEDAHPLVLVTQKRLVSHLQTDVAQVICLDDDALTLSQQDESDPASSAVAADLAYVLYTSGSTGLPKGAQVTHHNLLNLVYWHQRAFGITASDRATQVTSPAFDATGWEIWPYLTLGASVSFIPQEVRMTPDLLRDWLVHSRITITFLPTVLAESIMVLSWPSTTMLRFLLTGADALRRYPRPTLPFALINNYGLTETTVVSTFGQVYPTDQTDVPPSIGLPIANTNIYILDEQLQLLPIGEQGELCIGGDGVGKGYLNRPDLTAQRFVPDPFSDTPDARMYKTGDLACIRADGQIAFLGRSDQQIKIRGYRIEPNEIVSRLNAHPSVVTALVMAHDDPRGDKQLVAYIVPQPNTDLKVTDLRATLAASLPDYMIPASFVCMSTLPLTPNGKVDLAALPLPNTENTLRENVEAEPRTLIEERVATIVGSLLGIPEIGLDDNIFMLGGHSLLGTQVIIHLRDIFGVDLPLRTIFDAPTVRLLSEEIEHQLVIKLDEMSDEEALSLLQ